MRYIDVFFKVKAESAALIRTANRLRIIPQLEPRVLTEGRGSPEDSHPAQALDARDQRHRASSHLVCVAEPARATAVSPPSGRDGDATW